MDHDSATFTVEQQCAKDGTVDRAQYQAPPSPCSTQHSLGRPRPFRLHLNVHQLHYLPTAKGYSSLVRLNAEGSMLNILQLQSQQGFRHHCYKRAVRTTAS
ncbi:hypothetical protein A4X13_0g3722 [Tilletia indica]|uniref:Uncharacterized protein n=1 Tax=Tilletia indica TaxID=43049 RepID=A0A177TB04_9BASI|nr:hypothetical protein A4X13_0g3722 [Tilletia indica]